MQRRTLLTSIAALSTTAGTLGLARAQTAYPNQPIRWVVPYPAGGGTDVLARAVGEVMRGLLGQQIIVDNRPGASTNIGAQFIASSKADGYTLMSADNALLAFNEFLFSKLPFNPQTDFTFIGGISRFPLALVVHPSLPVKTVKEFIDFAKANPGKLNYASPGNGSPHHLAMEMFKARTATFITHIPYRGAAPAMQDVMGGQVQCMFLDLAAGLSVLQSGRVRGLGIGSVARAPAMPELPTLAEAGVPNTEVFAFQGLLGPANLPAPIVQRLNSELNKALADPGVMKRMTDFGMESLAGTPEQFRALARAEASRWGPIIQAQGIKLD